MPDNRWRSALEVLNEDFPLRTSDDPYPALAAALDDRVNDLLRDSQLDDARVNPLYVEDLLRDCVTRVSNCLVIREKAQDVESRAISDALNHTVFSASVNSQQDIATLLEPLAAHTAHNAISATITDDTVEFSGNADTWQKVYASQKTVVSATKEALRIQKLKASTPGNGSNYAERFAFLKRMFDLNLLEAYSRAIVCAKALKAIYGIERPLPQVRAIGYLDELAYWAQSASNDLDTTLDSRYLGDIAFAVAAVDEAPRAFELLAKSKFTAAIPSGTIGFPLAPSHFEKIGMKAPLLRSVRLQVRAKDESRVRFWPVQIELPESRLTADAETFSCVAPSMYREPADQESIVRGVHNIDPIGNWRLTLPDRSVTGELTNVTEVLNLYVFLRVSYRRP